MSDSRAANVAPGCTTGTDRGWLVGALAIVVASLLLRVLIVFATDPVLFSDQRDYYVLARSLSEHREYLQVYVGETAAFEDFTFRAFRPPGYPAFLATVLVLFGPHARAGLFANVFCDLVTQVAAGATALRFFGARSATVVLALLATHVLWTPMLLSECFYTMLFTIAFAGLVIRPPTNVHAALAWGLILSAALLTKPITGSLFPFTALVLWQREHGVRLWLALWLTSVLAVALWVWRNYTLFGAFVPLSTNVGWHNAADFGIAKDQVFTTLREAGYGEAAINSRFLQLERQIAWTNGIRWTLRLLSSRLLHLFSLEPSADLRLWFWDVGVSGGFVPPIVAAVHRTLYVQYYATYAAAAVGGAVMLWRRDRSLAPYIAVLMGSYLVLHAFISRGEVRFFAPLYPLVCLSIAAMFAPTVTGATGSQSRSATPVEGSGPRLDSLRSSSALLSLAAMRHGGLA